MSWRLGQIQVPDFSQTLDSAQAYQRNALAEMMARKQFANQDAYQQALQTAAPGLSSDDPTARRNALADLMRSGPEGAKLALPLLQQEREQAMIGSIMGGGAAPAAQVPPGQPSQGGGQQQAPTPLMTAPDWAKPIIADWSRRTGLPPALAVSLIQNESGFRDVQGPVITGRSERAQGDAQILPSTLRDPGYGMQPLPENASREDRLRFGLDYAAARIKASGGDVRAGLVGYGGGSSYPADAIMSRAGLGGQAAPTQQASAQPSGESPEALRQRATQLRLIPNQGAQALANSMEQRAQALEQRDFQLSQAQAAVAARREDAQQRTTERRQDMDERARVRREDQEIRRQERLEDRGNANPTYGNSLEGRALGVVEDLSDKIRSGQATADEVRRYQSSVAVLQQEKIAPDGTRITPRLPGYAPGQDEVQRLYGPKGPAQAAASPGATAPGLPTASGGVQEGTKTAPESAQKGMLENVQGIGKIDRALAAVEKAPGATGTVAGLLNSIPGGVADNWSPKESVDARAAIADVGSIVIHDRSGAAVTASEFPRLRPFIPAVSDSPEVVKTKLQRFKQEYQSILRDQYEFYGPGQGYRQLPVVEQALGGAGGKSEAKTARSDPAGIL